MIDEETGENFECNDFGKSHNHLCLDTSWVARDPAKPMLRFLENNERSDLPGGRNIFLGGEE